MRCQDADSLSTAKVSAPQEVSCIPTLGQRISRRLHLIQVVALYYSRNPLLIDTQLESPWDKGYPADCKNMQLEINFENRKTVSGVSGKVEHAKDITFGSITYFLFILADNYQGVPSK